jgi:hypothetical protein
MGDFLLPNWAHVHDAHAAESLQTVVIPSGVKVWPVRVRFQQTMDRHSWLNRWCDGNRPLTSEVKMTTFENVPDTKKFEKFILGNTKGRAFVMAMFESPIHEKSESDPTIWTVGFIFDVGRASSVEFKDGTHIRNP